jgi:hypothetical protein
MGRLRENPASRIEQVEFFFTFFEYILNNKILNYINKHYGPNITCSSYRNLMKYCFISP